MINPFLLLSVEHSPEGVGHLLFNFFLRNAAFHKYIPGKPLFQMHLSFLSPFFCVLTIVPIRLSYSFTPPMVSPVIKYLCRKGYRHTMGSMVSMVAAARTEVGVTALAAVAFFMDSALAPDW